MKKIAILFLMIISLTACVDATSEETSTIARTEGLPSSTITPEPSATPQLTSTNTALATKTLISTKYIYPTNTTSPDIQKTEAFVNSRESIPWLLYSSRNQDWSYTYTFLRADGNIKNDYIFNKGPHYGNIDLEVSPDGNYFAVASYKESYGFDQDLKIIDFQSKEILNEIPLVSDEIIDGTQNDFNNANSGYYQFIDESENYLSTFVSGDLEWSPNGHYLAYTSCNEGPTSDIYAYSMVTNTYLRMTYGSTQARIMGWSPDNKWIVHFSWKRGGYEMDGSPLPDVVAIWAVNVETAEIRNLGDVHWDSIDEIILGWLSDSEFVVTSKEMGGNVVPYYHTRTINIDTQQVNTILEQKVEGIALDPESRILVYLLEYLTQDNPGIFKQPIYGEPEIITDQARGAVEWMGLPGWFSVHNYCQNNKCRDLLNFPIGDKNYRLPESEMSLIPIVSPDKQLIVYFGRNLDGMAGIRIYNNQGELIHHFEKEILFEEGYFSWKPDLSGFVFVEITGSSMEPFINVIEVSMEENQVVFWQVDFSTGNLIGIPPVEIIFRSED